MYWILRRMPPVLRRLDTSARSRPSKLIDPAVGFSSPTIIRPIVVLPQPGLADQPERVAAPDVEAHVGDRADRPDPALQDARRLPGTP